MKLRSIQLNRRISGSIVFSSIPKKNPKHQLFEDEGYDSLCNMRIFVIPIYNFVYWHVHLSLKQMCFSMSGFDSSFTIIIAYYWIRLLVSSSPSYWRVCILKGKNLFDFNILRTDSCDSSVNFEIVGHLATWPKIRCFKIASKVAHKYHWFSYSGTLY